MQEHNKLSGGVGEAHPTYQEPSCKSGERSSLGIKDGEPGNESPGHDLLAMHPMAEVFLPLSMFWLQITVVFSVVTSNPAEACGSWPSCPCCGVLRGLSSQSHRF